jgi:hypothetical protein
MKPVRQQHEERRRARLEELRRKVAEGSLVIRQMTDEERARYPPGQGKRKRL